MRVIVSIDGAGRVVLPKPLREQFNLLPGSQLEINTRQDHLELKPIDAAPALVSERGLWVHQGVSQSPLADATAQAREQRIGAFSKGFKR